MGNDRSLLMLLGRELRESIHAGAALAALTLAAGCGGKDVAGTEVRTADHPSTTPVDTPTTTTPDVTDAATSTPGATDAATSPNLPRETYSLAQIGCFGPGYDGGYYGQCCFEAHCYTPGAGEACLGAENTPALRGKIRLPGGSGECGCSVPEQGGESLSGPFASNPADHSEGDAGGTLRSGSCCYVVGSISCTGRPFCVDGRLLLAEAVARADWLPG
jgi:hypothetical protein